MNTTLHSYLIKKITWEETTDPEYPYRAQVDQDNYLIRLNDFPAESLYTLIVNDEEVEDLDDWPETWIRLSDSQVQRHEIPDIKTDLPELVRRIADGDVNAEGELVSRYQAGVSVIINAIVSNKFITEDLSQETFIISLMKIRNGGVREPEKLSGFICSVARHLALDYIRRMRQSTTQEDIVGAEQIHDTQQDQFEQFLDKERAELVQRVISELKVKRDRDVLFRYYIAEEDKDEICANMNLTSDQFSSIIFRSRQRFKQLYLARHNKTD